MINIIEKNADKCWINPARFDAKRHKLIFRSSCFLFGFGLCFEIWFLHQKPVLTGFAGAFASNFRNQTLPKPPL